MIRIPSTLTMKTLFTLAFTMSAVGLMAQNANVVTAYNEMKDGNLARAAEFIEPATQDPKTGISEKTWRYRGDIYRLIAMGEDAALRQQFPDAVDKAIESYVKANELDTKGSYKLENGRALRALQVTALNAGNDAFGGKDYNKAIACYEQSERVAKGFGEVDTNAVFNKALAYESMGDAPNAIKYYKEAIAAGYVKPDVYRYIGALQRKANDVEGALATAREGRAKFPENKDMVMDEMSCLLTLGRADEAEASVKVALEKDPNNALLYSVLGGLYDKKASMASDAKDEASMNKWYDLAEEAYKNSIAKDANYFDAYFNIGVLYNNRAAYEYEKCNAIKSDTDYMKCKKVADDIYLKAMPYFEGAHKLDPKDQQTIQQLMKLYGKMGDQAKFQEMKEKLGK